MEPNQSAYCQHFSTETSVFKVCADILKAIDKWEITCLILLTYMAIPSAMAINQSIKQVAIPSATVIYYISCHTCGVPSVTWSKHCLQ